jgi:hypothetical protein
VESSYQGRKTTFTLNARENVPFKLLVPSERAPEWQAKVQSALDDGLGFEIDAAGVKAQGSPLLEQLFDGEAIQQATITISPRSAPVRAKLAAVDLADGTRHAFDDVEGHLFIGQASLTFKGELWEGLGRLTMELPHQEMSRKGRFSLIMDFDRWVGLDIRRLPYLSSILEFFHHADAGEVLDVAVFKRGQQLLGLRANFDKLRRDMNPQWSLLVYLSRASEVARALNVALRLPKRVIVGEDDFDDLANIHEIVTAPSRLGRERLSTNASFTLIATDKGENIRQLREQSEPSVIAFKQSIKGELSIFGQAVPIPLINITFNNVFPRVLDNRQSFETGDSVRVELEPADEFWMSYELAHGNADESNSDVDK